MRYVSVACAAAAAVLLGGCDAVTSNVGKYNPFVSFETRCQGLPPSRIEVRQAAIVVVRNDELSHSELTQLGEDNPVTHRTLGLTKTEFRQVTEIELTGLSDAAGGRSCSRPQIRLDLSMVPVTVYIASEFKDKTCARDVILEHEMKHVAVLERHIADTAVELREELPRIFAQRVILARDPAAAEAKVNKAVQDFLSEFSSRNGRELKRRQAAVDTQEEYDRVSGACSRVQIGLPPG
jgi:hypothetical protein